MTRAPAMFRRSTFERVAKLLREAPPAGVTAMDIAIALNLSYASARKLVGLLGVQVPKLGRWRAGDRASFGLRADFEERIAANTPAAMPPPAPIAGMCGDCDCKLTPSDFAIRDGRPYLPACPKGRSTVSLFRRVDEPPTGWSPRQPLSERALREAVIRALKQHEQPLTMDGLIRTTGHRSDEVSAAMTSLLAQGEIVKLIRTRPGRAGIAAFAVPDAVPDPLRAS